MTVPVTPTGSTYPADGGIGATQAPSDGSDAVNAASVRAMAQDAVNGLAYFAALTLGPTMSPGAAVPAQPPPVTAFTGPGSGISRIQATSIVAGLATLWGAQGDMAVVALGQNLYRYEPTQVYSADGIWVVTQTLGDWATSTGYVLNQLVYNTTSTNTYRCIIAGTSASTGTGPAVGSGTVTDGTVTWQWVANGNAPGQWIGLLQYLRNAANGFPQLDGNALVPLAQLPGALLTHSSVASVPGEADFSDAAYGGTVTGGASYAWAIPSGNVDVVIGTSFGIVGYRLVISYTGSVIVVNSNPGYFQLSVTDPVGTTGLTETQGQAYIISGSTKVPISVTTQHVILGGRGGMQTINLRFAPGNGGTMQSFGAGVMTVQVFSA